MSIPGASLALRVAAAAAAVVAVLGLPYPIYHYMDNGHPRPGEDYYGNSLFGPLQAGPVTGYYSPTNPAGAFKYLFKDKAGWSGEWRPVGGGLQVCVRAVL
jgi:hypothetical protein